MTPIFSYSFLNYHFKAGKRKISESAGIEHLVAPPQILDVYGVVEDDRLGVLDVAKGGHVEHHPHIVVGIAANLEIIFILSLSLKS